MYYMNVVSYEKSWYFFLCLPGSVLWFCTKKLLVSVNYFTHDCLACVRVYVYTYLSVSLFPHECCSWSAQIIGMLFPISWYRSYLLPLAMHFFVDNTIFACFNEIGYLSWIHSGPGHTWILAGSHLIPWFSPQLWSYHLSLTQVWTMDSLPS